MSSFFRRSFNCNNPLQATARAVTTEQALFLCKPAGYDGAIFICHLFKVIDYAHVIIFGNKIFAETFADIRMHLLHIDLSCAEKFCKQGP